MLDKKTLLLGAHMSIAGGLSNALIKGASIGCSAIQIFTKSNRQWTPKEASPEQVIEFKETQKTTGIEVVVAHASYLINLGSPDPDVFRKSVVAATHELAFCEKIGIPYLVLHPGSFTSSSSKEALVTISHGIEKVLSHVPGKSMIVLETMAGQGTTMGRNFSELAAIRALIKDKKRVGICLDTCHVFAAGYCLDTKSSYDQLWDDFDATIGLSHLKVIHVNDSLKDCGSCVDRHEDIGKGKIGLLAFELLMNDVRFFSIPKILETPKATLRDDAKNMKTLKDLLSEKNKRALGVK